MEISPDKSLGTVERCIYCYIGSEPFTREHILAAGLNGNLVLDEASCSLCQKIINTNIETPFLQGMFKEFRYRRGIGKRNLKDRPATLRALKPSMPGSMPPGAPSIKSPDWVTAQLPYDEHPSIILLPVLDLPGILRGVSAEISGQNMQLSMWMHSEPMTNIQDDCTAIEIAFRDDVFFRLLAKTAHCWAVSQYGLSNIFPYLTDIILGKGPNDFPYFIGGFPVLRPAQDLDFHLDNQVVKMQAKTL